MPDHSSNAPVDVDGRSLITAIPELRTVQAEKFRVEYGVRHDDSAVVFHFFPVRHWDAEYQMDRRLEEAILGCFEYFKVATSYAEELESFCVIIGGLGASRDPERLIRKFLGAVEPALRERAS